MQPASAMMELCFGSCSGTIPERLPVALKVAAVSVTFSSQTPQHTRSTKSLLQNKASGCAAQGKRALIRVGLQLKR